MEIVGYLSAAWTVASRDISRFWKYRFWLAGQLAMNLADVFIFALVFNNIVNKAYIPDYLKFMTPGVAAIATFAAAFSIGREVGVEIRREVTQYLLSLPMSRSAFVFGRILGGALRGMIYQISFLVLAALIVNVPTTTKALYIALTTVMLTFSMSSLAIAISTSTKDFNLQATLRALTYYILFFLSNVFYPKEVLAMRFPPQILQIVINTPVSLASDIYRWGFGYYENVDAVSKILLLLIWSLTLTTLASLAYLRNLTKQ